MWKIILALLVVLASCYAEETITTTPASNSTTGIEKEDMKIPNMPPHVRMMPYSHSQSGQPGRDPRNPGSAAAMNPRPQFQAPFYIPQSSTPSYLNPEDGNQALPGRGTRQGRQNPNIPEDRAAQLDPRTSYGYRTDGLQNPQGEALPNVYREDEDGFQAPSGARSSDTTNPRDAVVREDNVGEYSGSRQGFGRVEDNLRPQHRSAGSETAYGLPRYPGQAVQARRSFGEEQGTGYQGSPSVRGATSIESQQPAVRQLTPSNRQVPGVGRNIPAISRDPIGVQPRQSGQPIDDNSVFPPGQGPRVGHDGSWTSYRRYGVDSQEPGVLYNAPDEHQHRAYSFNYISESEDGMHGHQQTADESGKVIGSYAISLGDGRKRIVEYIADENGFRASIDTNEPGTSNEENPADIVYYNTPESGGRRATFQGLQDVQNMRKPSGFNLDRPSAPSSGGIPSHISPETQQRGTATRAQDSENRIRQPASGISVPYTPQHGAYPRLPLRRRLQDPQEDEVSRDSRSQAVPTFTRSQENRQNMGSQSENIGGPRPEDRSRVPSGLPVVRRGQDPSGLPVVRRAQEPSGLPVVRRAQDPSGLPVVRRAQDPSVLLPVYGSQGAQLDRSPEVPVYRSPQPDVAAEPSTIDSDRPAEDSFSGGSPYNTYDNGNRFWFNRN